MKHFCWPFAPIMLLLLLTVNTNAQALEKTFDQLLNEKFPADQPGAAVLVAKDGKIIYHKGFGMANLELDVKMQPQMVFEIGSITKQFTAVSILMLMEEGKLKLDDDITKFIPDYPTHGHKITIHHLLTHTSGIKSYTSMESWLPLWRKDMEPKDMIDFFKGEPMDFAPGTKYLYNNSAYFILGYVIEKASGMPYDQFLKTKIFEPLGMKSSLYGSNSQIIKNRASGYQKEEKIINTEYLSLTQPYAAGSIMSSVGDLFIWHQAIQSNKLIKKQTIDLAYTNYTLNDGTKINYGYGWGINEIYGSPTIEHSGGIFGYNTNAIYLPKESVFVTVFSNTDFISSSEVSTKMAAIAIGKPAPELKDEIQLSPSDLQKFVGLYEFEEGVQRNITLEDGHLYSQRVGGDAKFRLIAMKPNLFAYTGELSTIEFMGNGKEINVTFSSRINKSVGKLTDKKMPVNEEINVDVETLKQYVGVYALAPTFDIAITLEDGKLMTQATGQAKFEIFAKSQTRFFLKVVPAEVEFVKNADGKFDSIILYQGGRETVAKKK
ncbi:MAG: serine hydrolase [Saprospiraceae bacterium]|nr:serine hydrolase [Saprospiraceae bacterium]